MPGAQHADTTRLIVSIRARHVCRAMRWLMNKHRLMRVFQSAPGTCAGRCPRSFNPNEPSENVSIRARHVCRAMLVLTILTLSEKKFQSAPGTCAGRCGHGVVGNRCGKCFNPRPARVPGDAGPAASTRQRCAVSIRARHVCRAMHSREELQAGKPIRFQSAPGTCAGRCLLADWNTLSPELFQSAPGTCAGRCGGG